MGWTIKGLAFMYGIMESRSLGDDIDLDWEENKEDYTAQVMSILNAEGNEEMRSKVLRDSIK